MSDEELDFSDVPEIADFSGFVRRADMRPVGRVGLSAPVTQLLQAAAELEASYPGRSFLPGGFQGDALADVVAADALGLALPATHPSGQHGIALDEGTQVRLGAGQAVAVAPGKGRLVVLRIVSPHVAEIVYDGPGQGAWEQGRPGENGQRVVSVHRLPYLNALAAKDARQKAKAMPGPATAG